MKQKVRIECETTEADMLKLVAKINGRELGKFEIWRTLHTLSDGSPIFFSRMESKKSGVGIPRKLVERAISELPKIAALNNGGFAYVVRLSKKSEDKLMHIFLENKYVRDKDTEKLPWLLRAFKTK